MRVQLLGILLRLKLVILAVILCSVFAHAQKTSFESKARNAILIEHDSGAILYQKNADELFSPASMSKLMTVAIVFKELKADKLKFSDTFVMSERAWRTGGAPSRTSAMFVPVNKLASISELLQGVIVQSGNDAAIALAEGIAKSEQAFAKLMIQEARKLGLVNSTFANSTGLDQNGQLMTASEIARLSSYLIREYPEYYRMFSQKRFNYRRHKFINRNRLLFANKMGVDGLKTGYTKAAGYSVVISAVQNGRRLIAVLSGLKTSNERWAEAKKMLTWGFREFRKFKIFDGNEIVGQARVWGGSQIFVPLVGREQILVMLPRYPGNQKLHAEVVYDTPLKPPIDKGKKVASLHVRSSSGVTNDVPLYAAEDVQSGWAIWRGLDAIFHLAFGWLP